MMANNDVSIETGKRERRGQENGKQRLVILY